MSIGGTSAAFELEDGRVVYGNADFHPYQELHWYIYLVENGAWLKGVGWFDNLHVGWRETRKLLGMPEVPDLLPRTAGEGTDGGPLTKNDDKTHER